jgi:ribonuclease HI
VVITTDGSCLPNPGRGGWAAVLSTTTKRGAVALREIAGFSVSTTSNRMEMMGVLQALRTLKKPCRVIIRTDSRIVQGGMSVRMPRWRASGWPQKLANLQLWKELEEASRPHHIECLWVKGHAGDPDN